MLIAALAMLTVVSVPAVATSGASLAVTEFGYCLAVIALLPLLPGWHRSLAGRLGALLSVAAIVLLVMPVKGAMDTSRQLPDLFTARFGPGLRPPAEFADASRTAPFVLTELVRPAQSKPVRYEERAIKTAGGQELALHVYHPGYLHGPIPGVLVIHGEAWRSGSGRELVALNGYLAARDYLVAAINISAPPHRAFAVARDGAISALAFLKEHATEFGLDPKKLVVLGRSMGGHAALYVAYTVNDPAVRGAISLYAPTDLSRWYESSTEPGAVDVGRLLGDYLGRPPDAAASLLDEASPINFVDRHSPATLMVHGMRDEVVPPDQSERLDARLEQAGVQHLLIRLPWATHGCDTNFAGPCGQITTYAVERFLGAVTSDPRPVAHALTTR